MTRAKYIIVEENGLPWAIMFPASISHVNAVRPQAKPLAAGFFVVDEGGNVQVEGESNTLKLKSRPEDAAIIRQSLIIAGLKNFCAGQVGETLVSKE